MNAIQLLISFVHIAPVVAIVAIVLVCLPSLLRGLGMFRYQCGTKGGPSSTTVRRASALDSRDHRQLRELGFQPLGYVWERLTFAFGKTHQSVFVHSDEPSQTVVLGTDANGSDITFMTCFRGPALVTTANARLKSLISDDYARHGISTRCLKTLFDGHQTHAASLVATGHVPSPCDTLEKVAEAKRWAFCHPMARNAFCKTQWLLLCFHVSCLLTVPLVGGGIYLALGWPLRVVFHAAGWYLLMTCVLYPWLWSRFLRPVFGGLIAGRRDVPEEARPFSPGQALEFRRRATIGLVSFAMCILLRLLLA